jgi:hypothetical protein
MASPTPTKRKTQQKNLRSKKLKPVLLATLVLIALPCHAQTTTGKAETTGSCSPAISGSDNKLTITCSGVGKEQAQKILAILNKILANQLDTQQVMMKLDEISRAASRPTQNAPNGINIAGNNNGVATVNNIPPQRRLSASQLAAIQEVVTSNENVTYRVRTTNDANSQNYAHDLYDAISPVAKRRLEQGPIVDLGGYGNGRAPENVNVCSGQTGPGHDLASKIVKILTNEGTTKVTWLYGCSEAPGDEIAIVVGPAT